MTLHVARMLRPALGAALTFALAGAARATPTTTFWAPATPAVQPFGVLHVTYDTYFGTKGLYPADAGLELGVLSGKSLQAEFGFDLNYPTAAAGEPLDVPVALNAKLGGPEGALFAGAPAWAVGIYGVGFEPGVTDYDVLTAVVGKSFGGLGALAAGAYYGLNPELLRSSAGEEHRSGLLASWTSTSFAFPAVDHANLVWDVQTGENVLGATGGGLGLYFTPKVDLLLGPVLFFDEELQPGGSSWLWSLQFDADLTF